MQQKYNVLQKNNVYTKEFLVTSQWDIINCQKIMNEVK